MKRFTTGLLAGLLIGLLIGTSTFVFAGQAIKLIINGKEIVCDVPPQIINGRTMVPARYVAEGLGAAVTWDAANNAVLITSIGQQQIPDAPTDNILQENGIKYGKSRWVIEKINAKHPNKVSSLTATDILQLSDGKEIQLKSTMISNTKYISIAEIINQGLLTESDLTN